jgi:RNA polymerase sigma factor (TIGR02999 family)
MGLREPKSENITQMLHDWAEGDVSALDDLLPIVYSELHRRAAAYLRRERANHTLQATALVNEAYLKLAEQSRVDWKNRDHFFAVAAQAMRRILVDHARARHRQRRGGSEEDLPLEDALLAGAEAGNVDILALDEALTRLAKLNKRQEELVELRYFSGLSLEDSARMLGISRATAARDWDFARAWLYREMTR